MLELVVPDSGPLIGLALIDRLDLLEKFSCAILVTDMVRYEVERGGSEAPDRPVLERWFARQSNQVQVVETTYGLMYRALPTELQAQIRLKKNARENSIREFADHIRESLGPDDQILVLFEDQAVQKMNFGRHVHRLHPYGFFVTLENLGVIPSALSLVDELKEKRRLLARDLFERQSSHADGEAADWTEAVEGNSDPGTR